ncbi:MAG: MBL fold metallo-hydrolase, partial [Bacteroidota bacterium]
ALRVDDIRATLAALEARGVRLIDRQPRPGAEGAEVAFIHPSAAHGVLVELKQPAVRVPRFLTAAPVTVGDVELISLSDGFIHLDGGAMFGVVPRRMWSKLCPPDTNNMIPLAMRALLVRDGKRTVLIDTGIGNKQDDKFRAHFEPHGEDTLFGSLQALGVSREAVTDVLLTHLHFDHCGGALWKNETDGIPEPSFPNAVYWTNERHFQWAMNPNARESASFLRENFEPLYTGGRMAFIPVKQGVEFIPGISIRFTYGHTEAMMVPYIKSGDHTIIYSADTIPTRWHINLPYVMAYDVRPLMSLREKTRLLQDALKPGHLLFFEHDPGVECARAGTDEKGRVVAVATGSLKDMLTI